MTKLDPEVERFFECGLTNMLSSIHTLKWHPWYMTKTEQSANTTLYVFATIYFYSTGS